MLHTWTLSVQYIYTPIYFLTVIKIKTFLCMAETLLHANAESALWWFGTWIPLLLSTPRPLWFFPFHFLLRAPFAFRPDKFTTHLSDMNYYFKPPIIIRWCLRCFHLPISLLLTNSSWKVIADSTRYTCAAVNILLMGRNVYRGKLFKKETSQEWKQTRGNSLRDNDITVTRAQADYDTTATCQRNATASGTKSQVWVFFPPIRALWRPGGSKRIWKALPLLFSMKGLTQLLQMKSDNRIRELRCPVVRHHFCPLYWESTMP